MPFECCRNSAPRLDLSGEDSLDLSFSSASAIDFFFSGIGKKSRSSPSQCREPEISCVMPSDQLKTLATISSRSAQSTKSMQTSEPSLLCFLFFSPTSLQSEPSASSLFQTTNTFRFLSIPNQLKH
ncbi:hypothetical protein AAC387_Pa08g0758 [Persea americana]